MRLSRAMRSRSGNTEGAPASEGAGRRFELVGMLVLSCGSVLRGARMGEPLEADIKRQTETLAGCFLRGRRLPSFLLRLRFGDRERDSVGILPPDQLEWQVGGLGEQPALDD